MKLQITSVTIMIFALLFTGLFTGCRKTEDSEARNIGGDAVQATRNDYPNLRQSILFVNRTIPLYSDQDATDNADAKTCYRTVLEMQEEIETQVTAYLNQGNIEPVEKYFEALYQEIEKGENIDTNGCGATATVRAFRSPSTLYKANGTLHIVDDAKRDWKSGFFSFNTSIDDVQHMQVATAAAALVSGAADDEADTSVETSTTAGDNNNSATVTTDKNDAPDETPAETQDAAQGETTEVAAATETAANEDASGFVTCDSQIGYLIADQYVLYGGPDPEYCGDSLTQIQGETYLGQLLYGAEKDSETGVYPSLGMQKIATGYFVGGSSPVYAWHLVKLPNIDAIKTENRYGTKDELTLNPVAMIPLIDTINGSQAQFVSLHYETRRESTTLDPSRYLVGDASQIEEDIFIDADLEALRFETNDLVPDAGNLELDEHAYGAIFWDRDQLGTSNDPAAMVGLGFTVDGKGATIPADYALRVILNRLALLGLKDDAEAIKSTQLSLYAALNLPLRCGLEKFADNSAAATGEQDITFVCSKAIPCVQDIDEKTAGSEFRRCKAQTPAAIKADETVTNFEVETDELVDAKEDAQETYDNSAELVSEIESFRGTNRNKGKSGEVISDAQQKTAQKLLKEMADLNKVIQASGITSAGTASLVGSAGDLSLVNSSQRQLETKASAISDIKGLATSEILGTTFTSILNIGAGAAAKWVAIDQARSRAVADAESLKVGIDKPKVALSTTGKQAFDIDPATYKDQGKSPLDLYNGKKTVQKARARIIKKKVRVPVRTKKSATSSKKTTTKNKRNIQQDTDSCRIAIAHSGGQQSQSFALLFLGLTSLFLGLRRRRCSVKVIK